MLKLVPPTPVCYCLPWHLWRIVRVPVFGARCCFCDAEIAAPEDVRGRHVACIYCGLSNGDVPLEDAPFDDAYSGVEFVEES